MNKRSNILRDKTVLVTGGTGSFGHFVTRELLKNDVKEVRIFSRDEEKQLDMNRAFQSKKIKFIIGNVRDYDRVLGATEGVDILFHAAALKIIPTCESNPPEALKTNVFGTLNVKRAAIENCVKKSIFISTDKAVKPVNFYGMTKAIGEKIWVSKEEVDTELKFSVVRYGNVIGSRGSIVPYFQVLIQENKPLPITHPDMTRFLITLRQAIELVFYAAEHMMGGEIFVPDISACYVADLAKAMAGSDYPLKYIGIRPGEKIHECLIQEDEFRRTIKSGNHYIILPYGKHDSGKIREELTSLNAPRLKQKEIRTLLKESGWL